MSVRKTLVLGLALLLASIAFAGSKASLHLNDPVNINGTMLKPGDYKLEWEGSGPNVELSIKQGKTVVARVPARVVDLDTPAANDAFITRRNDNSLTGVLFQGKKFALQLGEAGAWTWAR